MQLLEVKNDTAKIIYNTEDNKLLPSDFLLIEDINQKIAGQIVNLYAAEGSDNNIAEVRLALSIDKDDKLSYYNGYIPPRNAKIMYITADDITEMIADSGSNIYLGSLSYHPKSLVRVPMSLVDDKLFIQCSRDDNTKTILQNIVSELYMKKKKAALIDFDGRYSKITSIPRVTITENFKFPLNADALDSLLEYDTEDCSVEEKTVIQSIVLELKDYIKTLDEGFLPLSIFKDVVINEFSANPIPGLMLLRNKLWKYAQDGMFAENIDDFCMLNRIIQEENIVIADASRISDKWRKFALQTIPKLIAENCYLAFSLNDISMDKRSILSLYNNPNITPIAAASYDFQYREFLKSLCKNQILFRPLRPVSDAENYSALINKLNTDDFLLYGDASLDLALIVNLKPFDVKTSEEIAEHDFKRNVDKLLYRSGKSLLPKEASAAVLKVSETGEADTVTDEDLDFLDSEAAAEEIKETQEGVNASDVFEPFSGQEPQDEILPAADDEILTAAAGSSEIIYHIDEDDEIQNETENNIQDNTENSDVSDISEIKPEDDKKPSSDFEPSINVFSDDTSDSDEILPGAPAIETFNTIEYKEDVNTEEGSEIQSIDDVISDAPEIKEEPAKKSGAEEMQTIPDIEPENSEVQLQIGLETGNDEPSAPDTADEPAAEKKTARQRRSKHQTAEETVKEHEKKFSFGRFSKLKEKIQKDKNDKKTGADKTAMSVKINKTRPQKKNLTVYEPEKTSDAAAPAQPALKEGDRVYHPKYGKGTVEGFANYSSKIFFCQVDFDNIGRRILDPNISVLEKIED